MFSKDLIKAVRGVEGVWSVSKKDKKISNQNNSMFFVWALGVLVEGISPTEVLPKIQSVVGDEYVVSVKKEKSLEIVRAVDLKGRTDNNTELIPVRGAWRFEPHYIAYETLDRRLFWIDSEIMPLQKEFVKDYLCTHPVQMNRQPLERELYNSYGLVLQKMPERKVNNLDKALQVRIKPELKQQFFKKCKAKAINPSEWIRQQIENFSKEGEE